MLFRFAFLLKDWATGLVLVRLLSALKRRAAAAEDFDVAAQLKRRQCGAEAALGAEERRAVQRLGRETEAEGKAIKGEKGRKRKKGKKKEGGKMEGGRKRTRRVCNGSRFVHPGWRAGKEMRAWRKHPHSCSLFREPQIASGPCKLRSWPPSSSFRIASAKQWRWKTTSALEPIGTFVRPGFLFVSCGSIRHVALRHIRFLHDKHDEFKSRLAGQLKRDAEALAASSAS